LLTNDSIFGPLFDLAPLFEKMETQKEIDFWGLTDSYEGSWHLQSFFICLSRKVFRSDSFLNFFKQDFDSYPKQELVKNGEILLSTVLIKSGFKVYATSPYKLFDPEVENYPAFAKNATHYYWDRLIKETQFPFVKKELILQNPENIQSIENLFPFLREISSYSASNIKDFFISSFNRPVKSKVQANVSVISHMYYPQSIFYFLLRLSALKAYNAKFFFNLSTALRFNEDFLDVLKSSFPDAVILFSPSQGRDIGGKMVALNAQRELNIHSDYTLIIHDKLSPHSPLGLEWRNKLFQIIDKKNLPEVFNKFEKDDKIGVIGPEDLIKNEYNADENNFRCNSSSNIIKLMADYNMNLTNYNYIAGTIFWIRTSILDKFFQEFSPLSVRASFEEGNALDFVNGTNIHAWERIFPFLANAQGFKLKGI
jgi:lipopolysaccharide biosynthesis protein